MKKTTKTSPKNLDQKKIVSNGRSHVEGASSNRDKDEDQLQRKNGVEELKTPRKS